MSEPETHIYRVEQYGKFAVESELVLKETAQYVTVRKLDWRKQWYEDRHQKMGWFSTVEEAVADYAARTRRSIEIAERKLTELRNQLADAENFEAKQRRIRALQE